MVEQVSTGIDEPHFNMAAPERVDIEVGGKLYNISVKCFAIESQRRFSIEIQSLQTR